MLFYREYLINRVENGSYLITLITFYLIFLIRIYLIYKKKIAILLVVLFSPFLESKLFVIFFPQVTPFGAHII